MAANNGCAVNWPGLLHWSTKYHDGTGPSNFQVMSDEDKAFLTQAMETVFSQIENLNQTLEEGLKKLDEASGGTLSSNPVIVSGSNGNSGDNNDDAEKTEDPAIGLQAEVVVPMDVDNNDSPKKNTNEKNVLTEVLKNGKYIEIIGEVGAAKM